MSVRKSIGKLGHVAKVGAKKAGNAFREGYGVAKDHYPQVKEQVKDAYGKANSLADKGADYAVRVRHNASESPLLRSYEEEGERHEHEHRHKRKHHRQRSEGGQNVTINLNVNGGRRKRKRGQSRNSGFSLI
jgi:hypothetical protein